MVACRTYTTAACKCAPAGSTGSKFVPAGSKCAPAGSKCAPAGSKCAPAVSKCAPEGDKLRQQAAGVLTSPRN